ncbi:MAG: hypothetical protein ACQEVA_14820 [Myxococcota bacterium]
MSPLVEKVITVALVGYVSWMVIAGRTLVWGNRDHPNVFLLNTRWVFRDEETGLYWFAIVWHVVLVSWMAYIAFLQ